MQNTTNVLLSYIIKKRQGNPSHKTKIGMIASKVTFHTNRTPTLIS